VRAGPNAARTLDERLDDLEPPTLAEGFARLFHLSKETEIEYFLEHTLGLAPLPFLPPEDTSISSSSSSSSGDQVMRSLRKNDRVKHLTNLGSASNDDKHFTSQEQALLTHPEDLYITEKVDASGVGFCVNHEGRVRSGGTCAARSQALTPFPPFTPQVMLIGCSSSPDT
jgi:hypothetical protein